MPTSNNDDMKAVEEYNHFSDHSSVSSRLFSNIDEENTTLYFKIVALLQLQNTLAKTFSLNPIPLEALSTVPGSDVCRYTAPNDFISNMRNTLTIDAKDKACVLKTLSELLSRYDDNSTDKTDRLRSDSALIEAYNLISQTKKLSRKEKIEWIETNNRKLPPPFLMLNTSYLLQREETFEEGLAWLTYSTIRMTVDAVKCSDKTAKAGVKAVLIQEGNTNWDMTGRKHISRLKNAIQLFLDNPTEIQHPYWLANHGLRNIALQLGIEIKNKAPFISESQWINIEFTTLQKIVSVSKEILFSLGIDSKEVRESFASLALELETYKKRQFDAEENKTIAELVASCSNNISFEHHAQKICYRNHSGIAHNFSFKVLEGIRNWNFVMHATNVGSSVPGVMRVGIRISNRKYIIPVFELRKERGYDFALYKMSPNAPTPDSLTVAVLKTPEENYDRNPIGGFLEQEIVRGDMVWELENEDEWLVHRNVGISESYDNYLESLNESEEKEEHEVKKYFDKNLTKAETKAKSEIHERKLNKELDSYNGVKCHWNLLEYKKFSDLLIYELKIPEGVSFVVEAMNATTEKSGQIKIGSRLRNNRFVMPMFQFEKEQDCHFVIFMQGFFKSTLNSLYVGIFKSATSKHYGREFDNFIEQTTLKPINNSGNIEYNVRSNDHWTIWAMNINKKKLKLPKLDEYLAALTHAPAAATSRSYDLEDSKNSISGGSTTNSSRAKSAGSARGAGSMAGPAGAGSTRSAGTARSTSSMRAAGFSDSAGSTGSGSKPASSLTQNLTSRNAQASSSFRSIQQQTRLYQLDRTRSTRVAGGAGSIAGPAGAGSLSGAATSRSASSLGGAGSIAGPAGAGSASAAVTARQSHPKKSSEQGKKPSASNGQPKKSWR